MQKPYVYVRIKSLARKDVRVRTKLLRAHKLYTYAISRSRAQVVLYVRNKSLYAQKSYKGVSLGDHGGGFILFKNSIDRY